jgi:hypothetical protein
MQILANAAAQPVVKRRLAALTEFLRKNRRYPKAYRRRAMKKQLYLHQSAKAKLVALFTNAIMSNAGGALEQPGVAVRQFAKCVARLQSPMTSKQDFLECLSVKDIDALFVRLQQFPCVGQKKAALFLRDVYEAQGLRGSGQVFKDRVIESAQQIIPFDVVIACVLNRLFGSTIFSSGADVERQFLALTAWAHKVSPDDHMIFEDIWYWGYFCLLGGGFSREVGLNEAKIYLDDSFADRSVPPGHFAPFIERLHRWE